MLLDAGKFALDLFKELRSLIFPSQKLTQDQIVLGTFCELYGSVTCLEGHLRKIQLLLKSEDDDFLADENLGLIRVFVDEVHRFGSLLKDLNMFAVELVYPDLANTLLSVRLRDGDLLYYVKHRLAKQAGLDIEKLPRAIELLNGCNGEVWHPLDLTLIVNFGFRYDAGDTREYLRKQLPIFVNSLGNVIGECRREIAKTITENWDTKEILTISKKS